jgi:hypothetical protein
MGNRSFRVEEANRLLPTVAAAMARLRALDAEARRRHEEAQALLSIGRRPDGEPIMAADVRQAQETYETLMVQGQAILKSLQDLGVEVRSIEYGLVDFPSVLDGQPVWLCWRLGEAKVAYYHGLHEGFAKRRPLGHAYRPQPEERTGGVGGP